MHKYIYKTLNESQKKQLSDTLKAKYGHSNFTVNYRNDESILGGLQVYFGKTYLDCSLASRLQKIKHELHTISF